VTVPFVSDIRGYRYSLDPASWAPWPSTPAVFFDMAVNSAAAAGYDDFAPDACLINRYEPGARLTLSPGQE
jgi:alkylated DNA repair protein (DNA oxidative demethylase)